jgi:DNA mismatch repair protein MutS
MGVAFLDISTGEFLTAEGTRDYVDKLMTSFAPKEVLIERGTRARIESQLSAHYLIFELDDWVFTTDAANERLLKQFETNSLKGFGIDRMPQAIIAAGATLHYLDITNHTRTSHITALTRIEEEHYVRLDRFTVRNLELVAPLAEDGLSLFQVINRTITPMGTRLLHQWVMMPLKDPAAINARLDIVEYFFKAPDTLTTIVEQLEQVGDLGRLAGKVSTLRVTPREVCQIKNALSALIPVKTACIGADQPGLRAIGEKLDPCYDAIQRIARTIVPDAPNKLGSTPTIMKGVSPELDELREIAGSGKEYLVKLQTRESEITNIPSLKIGFNNVFGYYIEVTNTHRDKVPETWIRKQTLVNAERYITPELKEYEEKILGAEEKISSLEYSLFNDLIAYLANQIPTIQNDAALVANLDCLQSFARVAADNNYARPIVDDSLTIDLTNARHPVIEQRMPPGQPYIANSLTISNNETQVMMITGPNMAGKSALLRQTALNVLMAQIGSFVPAEAARIGIVDKIFTRVGASDNISLGESTFMVEMNEAASIINNISQRSLILFDELGRGTSTYDGISIAWAIVEHIHQSPARPKTLFATHYHELNEMEQSFPRVVNFHVAVKEIDGRVVFIRKLERGGSEHSFGIHVARLAGMPQSIVKRADDILHRLEQEHRAESPTAIPVPVQQETSEQPGVQLSFFQLDDPVLSQVRDEILGIDINNLTPIQALTKLHGIKTILTGKSS